MWGQTLQPHLLFHLPVNTNPKNEEHATILIRQLYIFFLSILTRGKKKKEKKKINIQRCKQHHKKITVNLFQLKKKRNDTEGMIDKQFFFYGSTLIIIISAGKGFTASPQSASNTTTEHETDIRDYLQEWSVFFFLNVFPVKIFFFLYLMWRTSSQCNNPQPMIQMYSCSVHVGICECNSGSIAVWKV